MCNEYTFSRKEEWEIVFVPGSFSIIFNDSVAFSGLRANIDLNNKLKSAVFFSGKGFNVSSSRNLDFAGERKNSI